MADRVVIGQATYSGATKSGLWISKPGVDVIDGSGNITSDSNLLFNSEDKSGAGRYASTKTSLKVSGAYSINNFSGGAPTKDGVSYRSGRYFPLCIAIDDGTGLLLNYNSSTSSNSTVYFDITGSTYLSHLGLSTSITYGQVDRQYETGSFTQFSPFYTGSTYSYSSGTTLNIQPVTWTAGAGDHGTNLGDWYTGTFSGSSNANLEWNSEGYGKRIEFKRTDGTPLNSKFIFKSTGQFYTLSRDYLGGIAPTNLKAAVLNIPCAYGWMTSEYMGF